MSTATTEKRQCVTLTLAAAIHRHRTGSLPTVAQATAVAQELRLEQTRLAVEAAHTQLGKPRRSSLQLNMKPEFTYTTLSRPTMRRIFAVWLSFHWLLCQKHGSWCCAVTTMAIWLSRRWLGHTGSQEDGQCLPLSGRVIWHCLSPPQHWMWRSSWISITCRAPRHWASHFSGTVGMTSQAHPPARSIAGYANSHDVLEKYNLCAAATAA